MISLTLVPRTNGISEFSKVTHGGGKGQDHIVFTRFVLSVDGVVVGDFFLVVDHWFLLLMLFLDIAACVFVHNMNSLLLGNYFTKGWMTFESNCNLDVSIIFSFTILSSMILVYLSSSTAL